jgi:arginine:ornithine antiporter / lysine permease
VSIGAMQKNATMWGSQRFGAFLKYLPCSSSSRCSHMAFYSARSWGRSPLPSMAGVLEAVVGPWGKIFISVGLLISVLGSYLSWSLLAAEVLHSAAANLTMPSSLACENVRKVPAGALWLTNIVIQVFLLVTYFAEYAFALALKMTLIPLCSSQPTDLNSHGPERPTLRTPWPRHRLDSRCNCNDLLGRHDLRGRRTISLYAPGTTLFIIARREQRETAFRPVEWLLFEAILVAAVVGLYSLATGIISI